MVTHFKYHVYHIRLLDIDNYNYNYDLCQDAINMTELKIAINTTNGAGVLWIFDGFDELPVEQREENSIYDQLIKSVVNEKTDLSLPFNYTNLFK